MAKIIDSWPSDSPGYTHYFLQEPYQGVVTGTVTGLTYAYTGPPNTEGQPVFEKGDEVTQSVVNMFGQREFELAGTVTSISFDDGTTWTPGA